VALLVEIFFLLILIKKSIKSVWWESPACSRPPFQASKEISETIQASFAKDQKPEGAPAISIGTLIRISTYISWKAARA